MPKYLIKASYSNQGIKGVLQEGAVNLPDNRAAIALAATVGATGALSAYETVVLLESEEVDAAIRQSVDYRPPGG
ncbi:MAG TPA: hypothetical protein VFX15_06815 [Actinomycetes bacterium]|nr:hypothetical protein [Actinomycetes bacterium]